MLHPCPRERSILRNGGHSVRLEPHLPPTVLGSRKTLRTNLRREPDKPAARLPDGVQRHPPRVRLGETQSLRKHREQNTRLILLALHFLVLFSHMVVTAKWNPGILASQCPNSFRSRQRLGQRGFRDSWHTYVAVNCCWFRHRLFLSFLACHPSTQLYQIPRRNPSIPVGYEEVLELPGVVSIQVWLVIAVEVVDVVFQGRPVGWSRN